MAKPKSKRLADLLALGSLRRCCDSVDDPHYAHARSCENYTPLPRGSRASESPRYKRKSRLKMRYRTPAAVDREMSRTADRLMILGELLCEYRRKRT